MPGRNPLTEWERNARRKLEAPKYTGQSAEGSPRRPRWLAGRASECQQAAGQTGWSTKYKATQGHRDDAFFFAHENSLFVHKILSLPRPPFFAQIPLSLSRTTNPMAPVLYSNATCRSTFTTFPGHLHPPSPPPAPPPCPARPGPTRLPRPGPPLPAQPCPGPHPSPSPPV